MPAVRIEDDAFGDARYEELAEYAGLADADHARGKMARLWRQCTQETQYALQPETIARVLGPGGVDALIKSRLGQRMDDGTVRIKGTKGRIEWLKKLRSNGKFGKKGGRPKKNPDGYPHGFRDKTPLATATALVPALVQDQIPESPPPLRLIPQEPDPPDTVEKLWAEQERLRAEAIPGSRRLKLTPDRRRMVQARLDDGHTEDDLLACLREYAREATKNGGEWFNGETNWRPANVTRAIGRSSSGSHNSGGESSGRGYL